MIESSKINQEIWILLELSWHGLGNTLPIILDASLFRWKWANLKWLECLALTRVLEIRINQRHFIQICSLGNCVVRRLRYVSYYLSTKIKRLWARAVLGRRTIWELLVLLARLWISMLGVKWTVSVTGRQSPNTTACTPVGTENSRTSSKPTNNVLNGLLGSFSKLTS